jgi:transposase
MPVVLADPELWEPWLDDSLDGAAAQELFSPLRSACSFARQPDREPGRKGATPWPNCRRRGIQAKIAWPKSAHGSGLGTKRWIVERTIAWLHQYPRLRIRYERRDDIHEAFSRSAAA